MAKLTDTQHIILSQASQRDDRLAVPPQRLPAAARQTVAKALIRQELASDEQASAYAAPDAWLINGRARLLHITEAGLRAIGVEAEDDAADQAASAPGPAPTLPVAGQRDSLAPFVPAPLSTSDRVPEGPQHQPVSQRGGIGGTGALRMAAAAVTAAWDAPEREGLDDAIADLRTALAAQPIRMPRETGGPPQPRSLTKQEAILAMLRRDEGATIADIIDATGWQQHTVRGFLAGLKRKRRGAGARPPRRAEQAGRQRLLLDLPRQRGCSPGRGRLMRLGAHPPRPPLPSPPPPTSPRKPPPAPPWSGASIRRPSSGGSRASQPAAPSSAHPAAPPAPPSP